MHLRCTIRTKKGTVEGSVNIDRVSTEIKSMIVSKKKAAIKGFTPFRQPECLYKQLSYP